MTLRQDLAKVKEIHLKQCSSEAGCQSTIAALQEKCDKVLVLEV